jgi:hypothetical protein
MPAGRPACPLRLIDVYASATRKYFSIFKHIRGSFKEYLENISNMYGLYRT